MATSQQWPRVGLMVAAFLVVLFIGSADAWGCPAGYKDCNWHKPGCETNILNDVNNCGDCGKRCKAVPYASVKCSNGQCVPTCEAGWANCDGKWWNGCETDTGKDVKNCGECGKTCKQVPYATTKCSGGKCQPPVCNNGWANCDGKWWNGCETDTGKDVKNCGACGKVCKQVPYATTKCSGGKCQPPVCNNGWANCDGKWWNGCETDTGKDVKNCGACGKVCKQVPYATTKCIGGKCGEPVCEKGWANCDGNWWNGCETDTDKDVKNCGGCGKACKQVPYATTKCSEGKCGKPVCEKGWANCDGNWWNGCETDTGKDVKNCGGCGKACKQVAYATTKCSDGKCGTPVCEKGWANCDGNWWNGCETDTGKDVKNCGGCGKKCEVTIKGAYATCSNGECGQECQKGWKIDWAKKWCVKIE